MLIPITGPSSDDGAAFASSSVTYTVTYSDGSSEVVTYGSDGANGSTAASATTVSNLDGVIVDAGAGDDILLGIVATDTLNGGTGDDRLEGREGNDTLIGGDGNDILLGGIGTNTLTGGAGNDIIIDELNSHNEVVFNYADVGSGVDNIYGFDNINGGLSAGTEGDVLDISDILAGTTYIEGVSDINDYVSATYDAGTGDVTIGIDTTGGGATGTAIAVLHDEAALGSSASTGIDATVNVTQLYNDGVLITI